MKFSASFRLQSSSSSSLRLLTPVASTTGAAELPGVTAIRKKLVLTALERPCVLVVVLSCGLPCMLTADSWRLQLHPMCMPVHLRSPVFASARTWTCS